MSKAYWISAYRAVRDEAALAAYAKLAAPALLWQPVAASWRAACRHACMRMG